MKSIRASARALLTLGVVAAVLTTGASSAQPAETLDQEQTTRDLIVPFQFVPMQTFTAGMSGPLTRLDLLLAWNRTDVGATMGVQLREVDSNGDPVGTPMATATMPASIAGTVPEDWVEFRFTSPATVTAGVQYAIVPNSDEGIDAAWYHQTSTDPYPGGHAYLEETRAEASDFAFKTYVTPVAPPPDTGTAPPTLHCEGVLVTMRGTAGPDVLRGTAGRDVIAGRAGADVIRGFGGDDLICAGRGLDKVRGRKGDDQLAGNPGHDRLRGGRGDDLLVGGKGRDHLEGGPGRDRLIKGATS